MNYSRKSNKRIFSKSNSGIGVSSSDEREFLSCSDCSSTTKTNKQALECNNFNCRDQSCFSETSRSYNSCDSTNSSSESSDLLSDSSFKDNKLEDDRTLLAETIKQVVNNEFISKIESKTTGDSNIKKSLPTVDSKVSILLLLLFYNLFLFKRMLWLRT